MLAVRKPIKMLLVLALLALLAAACSGESAKTADVRPNILLILTDDQAASTVEEMPTVQAQLVSKGLSFENAFISLPACCPSRATILTGRYAHNHGVFSSREPAGGEQAFRERGLDQDTIATRLRAGGYTTGLFGKYLNGYKERYVPPGWDRWFAYTRYGAPGRTFEFNSEGTLQSLRKHEMHQTDLTRERAKSFVTAHADEPWFAYVAPKEPHGPHDPPQRHAHDFDGVALPEPPSFDAVDPSQPALVRDKPPLSGEVQSWLKEAKPLKHEKMLAEIEDPSSISDARSQIREEYEGQLEDLQTVDDLVAELLAVLKETEQLERTYILYMTDNGYLLGEHRLVGKGKPYEESVKTPLFVRGPGVPAGESRGQLLANVDIAQTLAELAGVSSPANADGRSFAPLLSEGWSQEWRKALLFENAKWSGVRTERYAYFEHETGERELYDLQVDPYELKSIHESADPALLEDLRARLEALKDCAGNACREADGP